MIEDGQRGTKGRGDSRARWLERGEYEVRRGRGYKRERGKLLYL